MARTPVVNLLPADYRRRAVTPRALLLLLLAVLGLLVAAAAVQGVDAEPYASVRGVRGELAQVRELRSELEQIERARQRLRPELDEAKRLRGEIERLRARIDRLKLVQQELAGPRANLGGLVSVAVVAPPEGMEILLAELNGPSLEVEGVAPGGFPSLEEYVKRLRALRDVASVVVSRTSLQEGEEAEGGTAGQAFHLVVGLGLE